jgi:hypothetical protein
MIKKWIYFGLFLGLLLFLPKGGAELLRKSTLSGVLHFTKEEEGGGAHPLELENHILKQEIQRLQAIETSSAELEGQVRRLLGLEEQESDAFFERRERYLAQVLTKRLFAVPGKVIFRDSTSWGSSLWINVGERDNQALGKRIIEKNSPVVYGKTVLGVVEEVESARSRVRLITDRRLALSVRAVRGGEQKRAVDKKISELIHLLSLQTDLPGTQEMQRLLTTYQSSLDLQKRDAYLAKGELRGSSSSLWNQGRKLKGLGFHYQCADEESRPLDLRAENLLAVGDILVTTGMDGVFPPDLPVAVVSKIDPLREGGTSFSLEAEPLHSDFNELTEVLVLPPNF